MGRTTAERFSPGPASPRARAGVVDVWRADLAARDTDSLAKLLCAQERTRARQIVRDGPRTLWPRSRGLLRALLARYLDCDPHNLRFACGPWGKPALRGRKGATDLRFNLAHSRGQMLVAVTPGRELGVDIERASHGGARQRHELALAARRLGSEHARRLRELAPDQRTREFLRAWSEHEATLKCLGSGLSGARSARGDGAARPVWTALLDVGPGAAGAVAVEGRERHQLRCFQWLG